jgi:hypothetical protein
MKLICKDFPRNINGIIDRDPNITIGKYYEVLSIEEFDHTPSSKLKMLYIIGNIENGWYWSDYFYTEKELRKLKLKKLNESRNIEF